MSDEVKACPFCGKTEIEVQHIRDFDGNDWWAANCGHCQSFGPSSGDKYSAIEFWNDREESPEDALRAELDAAKARVAELESIHELATIQTLDAHKIADQRDKARADLFAQEEECADLRARLKRAVDRAIEKCAQSCRYYLKHQHYHHSWSKQSEYERGVTIASQNIERLLLDDKAKLVAEVLAAEGGEQNKRSK